RTAGRLAAAPVRDAAVAHPQDRDDARYARPSQRGALRRRVDLRSEAAGMNAPAVYGDVVRYRDLFANLFRRDLQAKYRGSALGVLWTVANPVMLMGVYLLVFGVIWKSPFANGDNYALFLLSGLAVWTFFTAALL